MCSPVAKWTTVSASMLVYGFPHRNTGIFNMGNSLVSWRLRAKKKKTSVDAHGGCGGIPSERPDSADPVPRILFAGWLSFPLVTFQKPRHEEFLGQGDQLDPSGLAVVDEPVRI